MKRGTAMLAGTIGQSARLNRAKRRLRRFRMYLVAANAVLALAGFTADQVVKHNLAVAQKEALRSGLLDSRTWYEITVMKPCSMSKVPMPAGSCWRGYDDIKGLGRVY